MFKIIIFSFKGRKPQLLVADATTEMILGRREAGQMVREAETERIKREAEKIPVCSFLAFTEFQFHFILFFLK